jgi:hypothetical protein
MISDNVLLILDREVMGSEELSKEMGVTKWKLTTWGMIASLEQLKRNMEKKDFITLVWNSSLVEGAFNEDNLSDDEILDHLEGK